MSQVAALMNVGAAIFPLCAMFAIPALGQCASAHIHEQDPLKSLFFQIV
jgi:hypothetical protein